MCQNVKVHDVQLQAAVMNSWALSKHANRMIYQNSPITSVKETRHQGSWSVSNIITLSSYIQKYRINPYNNPIIIDNHNPDNTHVHLPSCPSRIFTENLSHLLCISRLTTREPTKTNQEFLMTGPLALNLRKAAMTLTPSSFRFLTFEVFFALATGAPIAQIEPSLYVNSILWIVALPSTWAESGQKAMLCTCRPVAQPWLWLHARGRKNPGMESLHTEDKEAQKCPKTSTKPPKTSTKTPKSSLWSSCSGNASSCISLAIEARAPRAMSRRPWKTIRCHWYRHTPHGLSCWHFEHYNNYHDPQGKPMGWTVSIFLKGISQGHWEEAGYIEAMSLAASSHQQVFDLPLAPRQLQPGAVASSRLLWLNAAWWLLWCLLSAFFKALGYFPTQRADPKSWSIAHLRILCTLRFAHWPHILANGYPEKWRLVTYSTWTMVKADKAKNWLWLKIINPIVGWFMLMYHWTW